MNTAGSLERFFRPRTIAVIGASSHRQKLGFRIFRNLLSARFPGTVYPVNPHGGTLEGKRVMRSVAELPRAVDCAVIVTPAATVPDLVAECGRKGIRNVIVISAGFREAGEKGRLLEEQLQQQARRYHIRLLGPNCLGYLHGDFHINASFGTTLTPGGSVTILSQSGAVAVALMDWAAAMHVGVRSVVSMGNKAGLTEVDLLAYFSKDEKTRVIACYLESMEQGEEFFRLASRVVRTKPVVILKAGESAVGERAVQFHTGTLAGNQEITAAALQYAGVIPVRTFGELTSVVQLLASQRLPDTNDVVVLTNAGGPGILAADALSRTPLRLAPLSDATTHRLCRALPDAASTANPVDIVGDADPERFRRALRAIVADPAPASLIVLLTPQVMTRPTRVAQELVRLQKRSEQHLLIPVFLGGKEVAAARLLLRKSGIPVFENPESAVAALSHVRRALTVLPERHRPFRSAPSRSAPTSVRRLLSKGPLVLAPAAHALLRRYGLHTARENFVSSLAEVPHAARHVGYPIALKYITPSIIHKTDVHAVWTNLASPQELKKAMRVARRYFGKRRQLQGSGWLVQRYYSGRTELLLGARRDPSFGPALVLGLGGVDVELLHTSVTIVPPFTAEQIRRHLTASPLMPWLQRRRGKQALPMTPVIRAIRQVGRLMEELPEVQEVDINPLLVAPDHHDPIVVDARFSLSRK